MLNTAGCWSSGLALCRKEGVAEGFLFNKEGVYSLTITMTLSKNERVGCSTIGN